MEEKQPYYPYSEYLKKKYGKKVYKLPVNLPVTCPNRTDKGGCIFCSPSGTGFEAMDASIPVNEQISRTKIRIQKKYKAEKFIAYFQNYTNTFLRPDAFRTYMEAAARMPDIAELCVSTRPDCIRADYLAILKEISERYHVQITIELGLQSVNCHTLDKINRGHTLAEFLDAVLMIGPYGFDLCAHVILNLPWDDDLDAIESAKVLSALSVDLVKIHSLYIAKNTPLCEAYENGTITLCSKEAYLKRLLLFLCYLSPEIAIERLFSRIPKEDAIFCNWQTSWWKLKEELLALMEEQGAYQGKYFDYLNGAALLRLDGTP